MKTCPGCGKEKADYLSPKTGELCDMCAEFAEGERREREYWEERAKWDSKYK